MFKIIRQEEGCQRDGRTEGHCFLPVLFQKRLPWTGASDALSLVKRIWETRKAYINNNK